MPILEKGCCCCALETCVKVQGWLALVGSLIAIALIAAGFGFASNDDQINEDQATALYAFLSILMVFVILGLVAAILLLVGVSKRKRAYLWPFMILSVLGVLGNIGKALVMETDSDKIPVVIFSCLMSTAIGVYYLVHIISLYQKFGEEERNPSTKDMRMTLA